MPNRISDASRDPNIDYAVLDAIADIVADYLVFHQSGPYEIRGGYIDDRFRFDAIITITPVKVDSDA